MSIIGEAFMSNIQLCFQKQWEHSRAQQAGFCLNRGHYDDIFITTQLMAEKIQCGRWIAIIFLDIQAAFDSIY